MSRSTPKERYQLVSVLPVPVSVYCSVELSFAREKSVAWWRSDLSQPEIGRRATQGLSMATADVVALYNAIAMLTEQVKMMTEAGGNRSGGGGSQSWDHLDRYKNLKVFDGDVKGFEEWSVKFRSLVSAGDAKVGDLMRAVEAEGTEDELELE